MSSNNGQQQQGSRSSQSNNGDISNAQLAQLVQIMGQSLLSVS
jgi:hypothetical protein